MADGTVVSFYSYKGGVGRTLALANVAAALAGWGYRVLALDWDLEAPGLSHYFRTWVDAPAFGLVDLVEQIAAGEQPNVGRATTNVPLPGLQDRLSLIAAGSLDRDYVARVQRIDWSRLYEDHDLGAALEAMRADWLDQFDFVLVDSRTGITDRRRRNSSSSGRPFRTSPDGASGRNCPSSPRRPVVPSSSPTISRP